jgi:hypothetical protein
MTYQTPAEETAAARPRFVLIPTDDAGLHEYIVALPSSDRFLVAAWLKAQDGRDYTDRVDRIIEEIDHGEKIQDARTSLREATIEAASAIRRAQSLHRELAGDELYDVEFAESGTAHLGLTYLSDAARSIDTYTAINPDGALTAPATKS